MGTMIFAVDFYPGASNNATGGLKGVFIRRTPGNPCTRLLPPSKTGPFFKSVERGLSILENVLPGRDC